MDYMVALGKKKWVRGALRALGVPFELPVELERETGPQVERPLEGRWTVLGRSGGWMGREAAAACAAAGAGFVVPEEAHYPTYLSDIADGAIVKQRRLLAGSVHLCIFDTSGYRDVMQLDEVFAFLSEWTAKLSANGRVIILAQSPEAGAPPDESALSGALTGMVRALSKELGPRGTTAHLVVAPAGAKGRLDPLVRFLASRRSAFVTGQTWRLSEGRGGAGGAQPSVRTLDKRTALVTGASRGIGAAIARSLAQEGADVIAVDLPERTRELGELAAQLPGFPLVADVAWPKAGAFIAGKIKEQFGSLDILVHNAGIHLDRSLSDMAADDWRSVVNVNLASVVRLTAVLEPLMGEGGRIIGMGSIAGLAGPPGHTCYSGSKAGMAEYLTRMAASLGDRGITVNTIAGGYIQSSLTAGLPRFKKEIGMRLSGMMQGGVPEDIGNLAAFLASPGAGGLTGQVIRACGAAYIGS